MKKPWKVACTLIAAPTVTAFPCIQRRARRLRTRDLISCVLLFAVLSSTAAAAQGQTSTDARNAISVEMILPIGVPIGLLVGERSVLIPVQIQYQRVVADHLVLLVKAGLFYGWTLPPREPERTLDLLPVVELDWHPFHTGLQGPYLGLSGTGGYGVGFSDAGAAIVTTGHYYDFIVGPTLGWQFLLPANITIDTAFGLGYGPGVSVDANGVRTSHSVLDLTRGGVYLGFRF